MTAPVRLGVIGAGGIAKAYGEILGGAFPVPAVAAGVADVREDAAQALAAPLGAPTFATAEALLEARAGELDAVVLCTPPNTHPALAATFAAAGVHVLCEKPLAVDRATAEAMVTTAAGHRTLLGMATKFRFCDDIRTVASYMADGRLGAIRLVENAFTSRVDMSNRWNADASISGGGVLVDNGTHSVDLLRFLLGPLAEVLAVETCRPSTLAVDDCVRVHVRAESGVDGAIDLAWSIDKSLSDFLHVYGTEGEARVGWRESAFRRYGGDWENIGPGYGKHPAMGSALAQFCRAVQGVEALEVGASEGVIAAQTIEATYESIRRGGWVKLAELG